MSAAVGIDFGTTNSALARVDDRGGVELVRFPLHGGLTASFRSLLFFEADREPVRGKPPAWVGPTAIERYVASGADGRLMQSMKSFLASRHLRGTSVFGAEMSLEALVAEVVSGLWGQAEAAGWERPQRVVAGRPVHFVYARGREDDAYAVGRLRKAFAAAGFPEIELVLEPVAAAFDYESQLNHDEVVLVADFGGGTSDFSLIRVGPGVSASPGSPERVLGNSGVGVAGDSFDARIIERLVAPALGKGSSYRTIEGNIREIPASIFNRLARWHELSVLKSRRNMQMLLDYARTSLEPDKLDALVEVVDADLGYALYQAVERTKIALSTAEEAELCFESGDVVIRAPLTRRDLEDWIAPELEAIAGTVDGLLETCSVAREGVDTVFLTGGSALVPAVRRLFEERFGAERIRSRDYLASVASGLARYASRPAG